MDYLVSGIAAVVALGLNADFVPALPVADGGLPSRAAGARGADGGRHQDLRACDSFQGKLAAIIQGSTETTFYVLASAASTSRHGRRWPAVCCRFGRGGGGDPRGLCLLPLSRRPPPGQPDRGPPVAAVDQPSPRGPGRADHTPCRPEPPSAARGRGRCSRRRIPRRSTRSMRALSCSLAGVELRQTEGGHKGADQAAAGAVRCLRQRRHPRAKPTRRCVG